MGSSFSLAMRPLKPWDWPERAWRALRRCACCTAVQELGLLLPAQGHQLITLERSIG